MPTQDRFKYTKISGTNSATANTQVAFAHGLGTIPDFYFVNTKVIAGQSYESAPPDATNIYLKNTVASVTFDAYCFVGVS